MYEMRYTRKIALPYTVAASTKAPFTANAANRSSCFFQNIRSGAGEKLTCNELFKLKNVQSVSSTVHSACDSAEKNAACNETEGTGERSHPER